MPQNLPVYQVTLGIVVIPMCDSSSTFAPSRLYPMRRHKSYTKLNAMNTVKKQPPNAVDAGMLNAALSDSLYQHAKIGYE